MAKAICSLVFEIDKELCSIDIEMYFSSIPRGGEVIAIPVEDEEFLEFITMPPQHIAGPTNMSACYTHIRTESVQIDKIGMSGIIEYLEKSGYKLISL